MQDLHLRKPFSRLLNPHGTQLEHCWSELFIYKTYLFVYLFYSPSKLNTDREIQKCLGKIVIHHKKVKHCRDSYPGTPQHETTGVPTATPYVRYKPAQNILAITTPAITCISKSLVVQHTKYNEEPNYRFI